MQIELPIINNYPIGSFEELRGILYEDQHADCIAENEGILDNLIDSIKPSESYSYEVCQKVYNEYLDYFGDEFDAEFVGASDTDNFVLVVDVAEDTLKDCIQRVNGLQVWDSIKEYFITDNVDNYEPFSYINSEVEDELEADRVEFTDITKVSKFELGLVYLANLIENFGEGITTYRAFCESFIEAYEEWGDCALNFMLQWGDLTEFNEIVERLASKYDVNEDVFVPDNAWDIFDYIRDNELIKKDNEMKESYDLITRLRKLTEDFSPQAFNYMKKEYGLTDDDIKKEYDAKNAIDTALKTGVSIYDQAVDRMNPEDIDHHETDLYLRKNNISTDIINNWEYKNQVTTFRSNIEPYDIWYEIPFGYPYIKVGY